MNGICKSKDTGVIACADGSITVVIGVYSNHKWKFGTTSDGRVSLHFKNIGIFIPRLQFEEDWDIIEVTKE